jgi:fructokinase
MSKFRIGVDIGGTKIEVAALDRNGAFAVRQRIATPQNDYLAALDSIIGLVRSVETEIGEQSPAGFGIPGTISPATGVVKNAYNSPFNGRPLDRDITDRLGRPIRMMNDANCFALSEAIDGAAAGAEVVFGVILGTGCGGGIVINGRPVRGLNAIAGEWGHNPLPWLGAIDQPARSCNCGKTGCIETYLSGTGFAAHYNAATGLALAAQEIVDLAAQGDEAARTGFDQYQDRLARALASIINVLDPDVIVLGGGMSNASDLYASVPKRWIDWVFSDRVATRLVPPMFGDSSGVRGAAWLWPDDAEESG